MRKELLGAISALALMTGAAFAQDTSTTTGTTAGQPAPEMQAQGATGTQPQDDGTEGANVTIIEPEESEAEATAVEPAAEGEEAEVIVVEPEAEGEVQAEAEGEATTTMAADTASAEQLMGMPVIGSDGEELGEVSDVIIDPETGEAQQVVIASGGFLGLGERTIAVDYQDLQIEPGAESIQALNLDQQMVEQMPEFEYTEDMASLGRQGETVGEEGAALGEEGAVVTEPEVETAQ